MWANIYADNRPETIRSIIVWSAVLLFTGYQVINAFVPNGEMIIYVRILDIAATTAALYIFAADAWRGLLRKVPKPRDFLIAGIWLKFFSAWLVGIYATVYRLADEPAWLLNNEVLPIALGFGIIGVVCHICTPGAVDNVVPRRNQYALAAALALAMLGGGFLVAAKPDLRPWLDAYVRPYIADWWKTGEARRLPHNGDGA